MTTDIKTALSELADAAPRGVETMAGTALRTAATRRRRRTAVTAGAFTLVVLLGIGVAVGGVPSLQRDAIPARESGGLGYPQRIQGPVPDEPQLLPARPGPLSGLMQTVDGWYGVRADGHLYQLPHRKSGVTLSPNGRYLTYMGPEPRDGLNVGDLSVRDLVKGTTIKGFAVTSANPDIFWSPDSTRFAVPLRAPTARNELSQIVVADPATRAQRYVDMPGYVTGFAGNNSTLVTIPKPNYSKVRDPAVRVVDLSGEVRTALRSKRILKLFDVSPPAAVSPDGSRLAVLDSFDEKFAYVDLRTGRTYRRAYTVLSGCPATWYSDSAAAIFTTGAPSAYTAYPRLRTVPMGDREPRVLTVVDPRLNAACLHLTTTALAGPAANGEFLDVRDAGWTWVWRELIRRGIAALVVLVLMIPLLRWWLRRHRARRKARPAQSQRDEDATSSFSG